MTYQTLISNNHLHEDHEMLVNFTCSIMGSCKREIVITVLHVLNSIFIIRFQEIYVS